MLSYFELRRDKVSFNLKEVPMIKDKIVKANPLDIGHKQIVVLLSAICLVTLLLRLTPWELVFGSDFVRFLETDAYNRMFYAQQIFTMTFIDGLGYMAHNNLLFSWIVALLGHVAPIEIVGAFLPPLIAVVTILVVYLIGKELFNPVVGLLASLFTSIIPSEFLHRSLLGFADHHVLEVLLLSLVILFTVRAIKVGNSRLNYSTLWAGISICLYCLNWASGIYTVIIIFVLYLVISVAYDVFHKQNWQRAVMPVMVCLLLGLIFYIPLGGYQQFMFLIPGSVEPGALKTLASVSGAITGPSMRTTSELMPLLEPYGTFNPVVVITNLHLFTVSFLLGGFFLWKYRHDKAALLLVAWTIFVLAMTLNNRRFLYYLTLNVGILSALAVYTLAIRAKGKNVLQNAIILTIPLLIISLPFARNMGALQPYSITNDWHSGLTWLKNQPDTGKVTAWSDYGHWIKYVSDKEPNLLPGPGGGEVAKLFLSENDSQSRELLDKLGTVYVIVDTKILTNTYYALMVYANYQPPDKSLTLASRLFEGKNVPKYLELGYENSTLKIYRFTNTP
jgi:asparagine N-glycosylation enzyme membrane subunit Stt3